MTLPKDRASTEVPAISATHGEMSGKKQGPKSVALPGMLLSVLVRFPDLVAANIVRNWPQLLRLIESEGFPPGIRLSPNARAWAISEVQAWLASRPAAGQGAAGLRIATIRADLGTVSPVGKPRKAGRGRDPSEEEAQHDRKNPCARRKTESRPGPIRVFPGRA